MAASRLESRIASQLDKEEVKKAFDTSHFDLNAILRGIQLTLVGGSHPQDARDLGP